MHGSSPLRYFARHRFCFVPVSRRLREQTAYRATIALVGIERRATGIYHAGAAPSVS